MQALGYGGVVWLESWQVGETPSLARHHFLIAPRPGHPWPGVHRAEVPFKALRPSPGSPRKLRQISHRTTSRTELDEQCDPVDAPCRVVSRSEERRGGEEGDVGVGIGGRSIL